MYTSLLAKQQYKIFVGLWQKQQLQLLTASLINSASVTTDHSIRQYTATTTGKFFRNPSCVSSWSDKRLYSDDTTRSGKLGKQLILSDAEEEATLNGSEDVDSYTQNFNLKQLLYTEADDIIKKLNACGSIEELQNILETEKSHLHKEHIVQSVILLWMSNRQNNYANPQPIEQNFMEYLLPLLNENVPKLNTNEMTTCYLYLRKMGVENSEPVMQQLLMNALNEVESAEEIIGLPALSRLVVGITTGRDFFTPMLCVNFMRHLQHHIAMCKSEEEARMIAICMFKLQILINDEMVELYKSKVSDLIAAGKISSATPKTVIKILNLLNMAVWSHKHVALIRNLLLTMETCIKQLDGNDLKNVCRIYQYHMEPAALNEPLAEAIEELLSHQMTAENLACFVPFAQPQRRESLINAFKAIISSPESWQSHNSTGNLFSTLRGLKISDNKICNAYWNGVVAELETTSEDETHLRFLRHCHRYMNFNNNLGGTYRHMVLEKKLSQLCMRFIEHDLAGRIPQKFARLASFVLAYGHTPYSWKKYPNILLSKIISMGDQFTPTDCFLISRGLQISLEMRYRYQVPQLVGMQLSTIDSVLTASIEKHLNDEQLTVTDLNMLVRTLSNRRSLKNSIIYHKTLQKYKEIQCQDLNSRIIKDMAYNFMATNYLVPEILDNMFTYLENNHEHVVGETVEKVLTCTYNLGYTPKSYDALHYAGAILLRDFNYMSGLALVQSCLALCFYKTIPEELINKVFCVKFIQRVEEEIQMCYSKATYPERVLNIVMKLNRSVCLDFPEANVPWFQQNFIEAQISKKAPMETRFSRDVKSLLTALLKNESYIRCNHTTPYGYQIDFVINFDKNKNPIKAPVETTMLDRITKVAILLLKLDSFCENDLDALRGPESLKIKHLEMMGYKVVHINEHDWNSKYMNAPGAKQNYLKCLLQISN
ncbi:FAST kinase domain-containing protein 1, mitochondrial [Calliphora vicina]|uniref:FAST kinase domain-containing protein 1, mitochondrial n=1 Tax=Calliphora vicina TaxID=7373 RepID=UPI00325A741E